MKEDPVLALIDGLAEAKGVQPVKLPYRLHDYIDPEVISRLTARDETQWELSFEVEQHDVRLTNEGVIYVDGVCVHPSSSGVRDHR